MLQCFHVLFLALHDWIPLGTLNDVKAVRAANPIGKLVAGTLISLLPFAFGLAASVFYFGRSYPAWLLVWLGVSYSRWHGRFHQPAHSKQLWLAVPAKE
jgi:hypothetical protein